MKRKLLFVYLSFIILIFVISACKSVPLSETPAFSGFVGTWERVNGTSRHTLTFTSTTIKASNQNYDWNISSVSGDVYTIYPTPNPNLKGTISIKRVGDYLEVIDAYDMSNAGVWSGGEDDWTGRWRMK